MQLVHTVLLEKEERPKMSTVKRVTEKGLRVKKKDKTGRLFTIHPCTAQCLVSIARNIRETRLIIEGSELPASRVLQSSTGTEKADVNLTKEALRWRKVDDTAPTYGDCRAILADPSGEDGPRVAEEGNAACR